MCIANRERNAGFAMEKHRKVTGEWGERGGEDKNRCGFSHLPKCSLVHMRYIFLPAQNSLL